VPFFQEPALKIYICHDKVCLIEGRRGFLSVRSWRRERKRKEEERCEVKREIQTEHALDLAPAG
jgi:hypothetical protein